MMSKAELVLINPSNLKIILTGTGTLEERWECVEKRKICWKVVYGMEANKISFLTGCKVSLSQGRHTWRHNQVLKTLAANVYG